MSFQHFDSLFDCFDHLVDFGFRVVEGEGGADGAWDSEMVHHGLGAVVPCAYGNPHLVYQSACVEMVYTIDYKRDNCGFVL